jgi:hypothetical protein
MEIHKAVITAAGPSQRSLPLQTLVKRQATPVNFRKIRAWTD